MNFSRRLSRCCWFVSLRRTPGKTLVRPGRKIPVGERIVFGEGELQARVEARAECGLRVLRFESKNGFHEALNRLGHIPLPPYIKRADEPLDRERYQTVYAQQGSAVAAPTAGLHFTPAILDSLRQRGIEIAKVTLDVGLGTFEPIRTESLEEHKIHVESYEIPEATVESIARAKREQRPVLAVGTTVVRALEDAAEKAAGSSTLLRPGQFEASIFLLPGKPFRVVDQLLTNFHLPRSSLLALVAAFAGLENTLAGISPCSCGWVSLLQLRRLYADPLKVYWPRPNFWRDSCIRRPGFDYNPQPAN